MDRRGFVHTCALSLAGASRFGTNDSRLAPLSGIGLELYSVRDAMRANPERTLAAVRAIGYTDVELLWSLGNFGRTPQQVRESLAREGLRAPSAHIAPEILLKDWEKSLADAALLGLEYLIVPSLPARLNIHSTSGSFGRNDSTRRERRRGAPGSGSPFTTNPITSNRSTASSPTICFSNEPTRQRCDISSILETWSWAAVIRSATSAGSAIDIGVST